MSDTTATEWSHFATRTEGTSCVVDGLNLWEHRWLPVNGSKADVRDPVHGQSYRFDVFNVLVGDRSVTFAAGEFSPNVWGFFLPVARSAQPNHAK